MKKMFSVLLMVIGIGVFAFGSYMAERAEMGQMGVSQAEQEVDEEGRPIFGPVRRGIRSEEEQNARQKIGQTEQTVVQSQITAGWLRGTGAVIFITGVGFFIFNLPQKRRDL